VNENWDPKAKLLKIIRIRSVVKCKAYFWI